MKLPEKSYGAAHPSRKKLILIYLKHKIQESHIIKTITQSLFYAHITNKADRINNLGWYLLSIWKIF